MYDDNGCEDGSNERGDKGSSNSGKLALSKNRVRAGLLHSLSCHIQKATLDVIASMAISRYCFLTKWDHMISDCDQDQGSTEGSMQGGSIDSDYDCTESSNEDGLNSSDNGVLVLALSKNTVRACDPIIWHQQGTMP